MYDPAWWARFLLAVLATWRVTHLLANEDGPADLIVRFRAWLGSGILGKLMDCFHCLSLWIAAPAALFVTQTPLAWMFTWLALSGAACLLERTRRDPVVFHSLEESVEGEMNHALLRPEERRPEEGGVESTGGESVAAESGARASGNNRAIGAAANTSAGFVAENSLSRTVADSRTRDGFR